MSDIDPQESADNGIPNAANGSSEPESPPTAKGSALNGTAGGAPSGPPKAVEDVIYSDIGITTLLNRLKQSIASARDFAAFLKKRSGLEEEHATSLKRLAKAHLEAVRRPEMRTGSYAHQLSEVLRVHERMGDNGMQFAMSLHQMHEDLNELSNNMERGRKQWKHEGLDAEKRASDAEQTMHKAKAKYDALAESYDRARTGDTKGSRRLGLKGPKSAEQYEQDMLGKVQTADADYEERVRGARLQRDHLINTGRPQAVRALQELIRECDSGLTLQLQKYATFNEKLLLGNGLAVSPLADKAAPGSQRSMRDIIVDIDNDRDLYGYIGAHANKIPPRAEEIRYEKHPTLAPKQQQPSMSSSLGPTPQLTVNTASSQPGSTSSRTPAQPAQSQPAPPSYAQSPSAGYPAPRGSTPDIVGSSPYRQHNAAPYDTQQSPMPETHNAPPYPMHPSERAAGPAPSTNFSPQTAGPMSSPSGQQYTPTQPQSKALRPSFGVSLEELFNRDESPVPILVYQCMQAVELFGLDVEGIYRLSGISSLVNKLRDAFNQNAHSPNLDFRNPANFYHDVNSVATLLKQFFRDLPEPLFTRHAYEQFIDAAKVDDENGRRDALHQLINELPDPNYATLRALVLHLHRVTQHESRNRMGSSNLAICFA